MTTKPSKQKKQSQSTEPTEITCSIKEVLQHEDFLESIRKTVQRAIREEMKELKEEVMKLSNLTERNESRILELEIENDNKTSMISNMERYMSDQNDKIKSLQNQSNTAEQYSRRNCVRIFGVPETKIENTDEIMINIAQKELGIDLTIHDIERSHRTGAFPVLLKDDNSASPTSTPESSSPSTTDSTSYAKVTSEASRTTKKDQKPRYRPIIVKLISYRKRQDILHNRRKLVNTGKSISEDLTAINYNILKTARKSKNVTAVWSLDGRVFVAIPSTSGKPTKKLIKSVQEAEKL